MISIRLQPTLTRHRTVKVQASCAAAVVLAAFAVMPVFGAITSENHPKLKAALVESPKADTDRDGVLSYAEYEAWVRSRQHERMPAGHQRGLLSMVLATGEVLIADFEDDAPAKLAACGWKVEGQAFGKNTSQTTRLIRRRVGPFSGKNLLSSMGDGDGQVGSLLSPPFELELPYVEFQLSGGAQPRRLCVNLLVDGKVVRSATGRNDDRLEVVAFDVAAIKGREARLQIVDADRGVWGHINVDRVVQSETTHARRIIIEPPATQSPTHASVLAVSERIKGTCVFEGGSLLIDGKSVPLDDVLLVVFSGQPEADSPPPHQLKLVNGESWAVRIVKLETGKVSVESTLLGNRQVPMAQVASLVFQQVPHHSDKPGSMYRSTGDSIRGELVWIRENDIAIDCALGVVPLPRSTVLRYVVRLPDSSVPQPDLVNHAKDSASPPRLADEVGLMDGSLLRGRLSFGDDGLSLAHPDAGAITLNWQSIRYIRRAPPQVRWLENLRMSEAKLVGPISPPPAPRTVDAGHASALRMMRVMPHTTVQLELEGTASSDDSKPVFRAGLMPLPGARASVHVRIAAGGKTIWERIVAADSEPETVSVPLPATDRFSIEVDYAGPVAFPAGVDLLDAHVVASAKPAQDR